MLGEFVIRMVSVTMGGREASFENLGKKLPFTHFSYYGD